MNDEYDENEYYDTDSDLDDADFDIEPSDDEDGDDDGGYYDAGLDDLDSDGAFGSSFGSTTEPKKEDTKQDEPVKEEKPEIKAPENASDLIKKISKEFQTCCLELSSTTKDYSSLADLLWGSELLSQGIKDKVEELIAQPQFEAQHIKDACKFFTGFFDLAIRGGIDYDKFTDDKEKKLGFASLTALGAIFKQAGNNAAANVESAQGTIDSMAKMIDDSKTIATNNMKEGQTYYTEDDYKKDLENIVKFVIETRSYYDIDANLYGVLMKALKSDLDTIRAICLDVWKQAWSVHPYIGVLTEAGHGTKYIRVGTLSEEEKAKKVQPEVSHYAGSFLTLDERSISRLKACSSDLKKLASQYYSSCGLTVCSDRQFDYDKIINEYVSTQEGNRRTFCFPLKQAEFIFKKSWIPSQEKEDEYVGIPKNAGISSAEAYYDKVVASTMNKFVAKACVAFFKKKGIAPTKWVDEGQFNSDYKGELHKFVAYLTSCITSCVYISHFEQTGSEIAEVGICRVGGSRAGIKVPYFADLFAGDINAAARDNDRLDLLPNSLEAVSTTTKVPRHILHYVKNQDFVYGKPQFAYKVLKNMVEQGDKLSWGRVLIGEREDYTSFMLGSAFSEVRKHYIFAGSRSGKGVMCSNLLCTAIASRKPIFYMDRKPDTSVMLYKLSKKYNASGGGMYCVNGGQHEDYLDPDGDLKYSTDLKKYVYPAFLKRFFTNYEYAGDACYVRGLLLTLEMLVYYSTHANTNFPFIEYMKSLKGIGTPVIVIDEFNNLELRLKNSTYNVLYGAAGFDAAMNPKSIRKAINKLVSGVGKKKDGTPSFEDQFKDIDDDKKNTIFAGLYLKAMLDGIPAIFDGYASTEDAGGHTFAKESCFFMIGQNIEVAANGFRKVNDQADYFPSDKTVVEKIDDAAGYIGLTKGYEPISGYLFGACGSSADFFIGYNGGNPMNYCNQDTPNSYAKTRLTEKRRMFAYKKGTFEALRGEINPPKGSSDASGWEYIKPYLILNDSITPPLAFKDPSTVIGSEVLTELDDILDLDKSKKLLCSDKNVSACKAPVGADYKDVIEKQKQTKGLGAGDKLIDSQFAAQCLFFADKAGIDMGDLLEEYSPDESDTLGLSYQRRYNTPQFHSGTGFEGYLRVMVGNNDEALKETCNSLCLSGEIMNKYVQLVYGYKGDYQSFITNWSAQYMVLGQVSEVDDNGMYKMQEKLKNYFGIFSDQRVVDFFKPQFDALGLSGFSEGGIPMAEGDDGDDSDLDAVPRFYETSRSAEKEYEKSDAFRDTTTYSSEKAETPDEEPDDSAEDAKKPKTDAEIRAEVEAEYGNLLKNNIIPRLRSKHKYKASLTVDAIYEIAIQCMVEAVKERGE